ncbi:glycoside hydrolase family 25 protein [uncultured Duncaniella sp.]|uniref:glycoside hydrolase family 25 protein n=1 Tax=uncultured Duncaniella sp. TaxID=2768039 RepID=UPI0025FE0BE0|nr:GH25 family lysozyme [uncultured Duncaniella sp.]
MRLNSRTIMRLLPALLAGMLLSACRGEDNSPHSVAGFKEYEILGIDVSAHNGDIDFEKVSKGGIEFVIIKATEGGTFKDRMFVDNVRKARKAGLKIGAYHFFRFDTPGYIQGLNFANSIHGRNLDLPAVIDIEEYTNPNLQRTKLVMSRVSEMADYLEKRGYRVMLYTNKKGHARFISGQLATYPLWLCSLGTPPEGIDCDIWQATHHGKVSGIDHEVDINVFTGTRPLWDRFASGIKAEAKHGDSNKLPETPD